MNPKGISPQGIHVAKKSDASHLFDDTPFDMK
jgi:hypothetical protein